MLNRKHFKVKARYIPTNRVRTVEIWARSEEEAKNKLLSSDYSEIVSISRNFHLPTEKQIAYAKSLGIQITSDMERQDISELIDRKINDKSDPNPGLVDFAENRDIIFSSYIGKKNLYNLVFSELPNLDKIAFFIFSVYRYLSSDREANLDISPYKSKFYEFAQSIESNDRLLNSLLSNYRGEDLRFFGTLHINSYNSLYGGSKQTAIYKAAIDFLLRENLLTQKQVLETKKISDFQSSPRSSEFFSNPNTQYDIDTKDSAEVQNDKKDSNKSPSKQKSCLGCLLWIVAIIMLVIVLASIF